MQHPEYKHKSSIQSDGSRPKIIVSDVKGIFQRLKGWVYYPILTVFLILPWLFHDGKRIVLFFIEKRQFYFFGFSFNAQDIYLIFFLVTGLGFGLFFITAVLGRVWCGWLCPQTLLLEGIFRKIERLVDGSKAQQIRLASSSMGSSKIFKRVLKYALYGLASLLFSSHLVLYFVPQSYFLDLLNLGLGSHPKVFFWLTFFFTLLLLNFSWFREQTCLILCPYGRFQSALTDDDTLVIGYDVERGEPRGKVSQSVKGDCINCNRCVDVCPTGIDIREGLQMECIGCANCIDACNEIMVKVDRPQGLIRYDSLNGFEGKKKRILRPRVYGYITLLIIGIFVSTGTLAQRENFESNFLRIRGTTYTFSGDDIQNQFELHLVNKSGSRKTYHLEVEADIPIEVTLPFSEISLEAMKDQRVPIFVRLKRKDYEKEFELRAKIKDEAQDRVFIERNRFLGPD